jgi:NADPH:quinone reductase-like Zn-dependent oxidoreductase
MRAPISGHGPRRQLKHVNLPTVPTGMVRVRVIAAGINRADFYKLDGTYGASPTTGTFPPEWNWPGSSKPPIPRPRTHQLETR